MSRWESWKFRISKADKQLAPGGSTSAVDVEEMYAWQKVSDKVPDKSVTKK